MSIFCIPIPVRYTVFGLFEYSNLKAYNFVLPAYPRYISIVVTVFVMSSNTVKTCGSKRPIEEDIVAEGNDIAIAQSPKPSIISTPMSNKVQKRSDPILWDDYFMAIAFLSAMRSKDPSTQVLSLIHI